MAAGMLAVTLSIRILGAQTPPTGVAPRIYGDVALSKDRIAFEYAGQLWDVARAGGVARLLSNTLDEWAYPVYSPDGSRLAYARANGLWVMPSAGGKATRLTWNPQFSIPRAWSRDGNSILFCSPREQGGSMRAYTVPADGGPETLLPLNPVRFVSYSPDGKRLAVVGRTPFFYSVERRFYRGGDREPIQLLDPRTGRGTIVPAGDANAIFPMWVGRKIYFASDSLGAFNLAEYDTLTRTSRLLTRWRSFGLTTASAGPGGIAFVRDGRVQVYDLATGQVSVPSIVIPADTAELAIRTVPLRRFVANATIGARGELLALEARGDVVVMNAGTGRIRSVTQTSGVAERSPVLSPDGRSIAYFTDESGEYALAIRPISDSGETRVIALGAHPTFFSALNWSPDSRRLSFSDQRLVLWLADVTIGRAMPVDSSRWIAQGDWQTAWSQDSRWIAYAKADPKGIRAVWMRDVESGKAWPVSSGGANDISPAFDPSGRWLYFASSSTAGSSPAIDVWALQSSMDNEPRISYRVMAAVLRSGDVGPRTGASRAAGSQERPRPLSASDVAGAAARVVPLPVPSRIVQRLWATPGGALVVQVAVSPTTPAVENATIDLLRIDLATPRAGVTIAEGIDRAGQSPDGSAMLIEKGRDLLIASADSGKASPTALDLSGGIVTVVPRSEWRQEYHEAFRMMRDYFYDPGHHGVDMAALEHHFAAYLPELVRREDLNTLLRLAFGEISVSHLRVAGGDSPSRFAPADRIGLLGADFEVHQGRYRIKRVLANAPYSLNSGLGRSPLAQPGQTAVAGEYLVSVDGVELRADRPLESYFVGKSGQESSLRVAATADGSGARDLIVTPVGDEGVLRLYTRAEDNRREVERRSHGRLAYVLVDAWSAAGSSEMERVLNGSGAEGLIIDERWNGGGITPDVAIDALMRQPMLGYIYRYGDGFSVPHHLIPGPKVLLVNEEDASAAETFAMMFKERRAGKVVGTTTFGGGVGGALSYQRLVDGGSVTIPNRAVYNPRTGTWDVENRGVLPDIPVQIKQTDAVAGHDPQLERGIEAALTELARRRPPAAKRPRMPVHPPREQ